MAMKISHGLSKDFTLGVSQRIKAAQLQKVVVAQPLQLHEMIVAELSCNPALELSGEERETMPRRGVVREFNEEFVKPPDEWENGDPIAEFEEDEPGENESSPIISPATFRVFVENHRVIALVAQDPSSRFWIRAEISSFNGPARQFLERLKIRQAALSGIASEVLAGIQSDFFRQDNLARALLVLVPIPIKGLEKFIILPSSGFNQAYASKLGRLLVESPLGEFPLGLFWQEAAAIRRIWVRASMQAGEIKPKEICNWIRERLHERTKEWPSSDHRHILMKPLLEMTTQDVQNALKKIPK